MALDQQLQAELAQLVRTMQQLVHSQSESMRAVDRTTSAQNRQAAAVEETIDSVVKGRKLNEQQYKLLEKLRISKEKEVKAAEKASQELERLQKATKLYGADDARTQAIQKRSTLLTAAHARAQTETNKSALALDKSFKGLIKGVDVAGFALTWFGATVRAQGAQLLAQQKANSGVIEGSDGVVKAFADQQMLGLKYRLSGEELAKITVPARQMFNAMGGTAKGLEELSPTIDRFRILTGSSAEGLELATQAAQNFAKQGVKPTQAGLNKFTDDVVDLQRRTGMSAKEAVAYFNDIANDTDSIDLLRKARVGERESVLASQRAFIAQAHATGMSTEQAKEAAKMFNKMVSQKPMDRIKQAAKIRALGGAMGIAGANEAAEAMIAGPRATKEQRKNLEKFHENATTTMDAQAQKGLGSEIVASQLLDKLDLDQYYGKGSPFSTTLADTLKPQMDLQKAYIDTSKDATVKMIAELSGIAEQIKLVLSGTNFLGVIAAGVAAILATLVGGKLMDGIGKVFSKGAATFGETAAKAFPTIEGAAEGAAGTASKAGSLLGKVGGVAKVVGKGAGVAGAVLDAGMGINDLMNGKQQKEMSGTDYISPMRWGMYGGQKINEGVESMTGGTSIGSSWYEALNHNKEDEVAKMLAGPKKAAKNNAVDSAGVPAAPVSSNPATVDTNKKLTPLPLTSPDGKTAKKMADATEDSVKSGNAIKDATQITADGITTQIKKLDQSNDILTRLADATDKHTDLLEKQLVALTMSDSEKNNADSTSTLRKDNKFAAKYGYV